MIGLTATLLEASGAPPVAVAPFFLLLVVSAFASSIGLQFLVRARATR